jgi:hypothetical protein
MNFISGTKNGKRGFYDKMLTRRPILTIDITFYLATGPLSVPPMCRLTKISFAGHKTTKTVQNGHSSVKFNPPSISVFSRELNNCPISQVPKVHVRCVQFPDVIASYTKTANISDKKNFDSFIPRCMRDK